MSYAQTNLTEYMRALSDQTPTPGGGSASALCGAQGASLVCMVAALTLKKEKLAAHHALCREAQTACAALRDALLAQIDIDCAAYEGVIAAYRLPKEQPEARAQAVSAALLAAARAPLCTMRLAREALLWALKLAGHSNPNCFSDLLVAAYNLSACARGAWENVRVNVDSLPQEKETEAMRAECARILKEMDAGCEALRQA